MADWHLAAALVVLRDQVNTAAPARSKRTDGTIGDKAHANRVSDHNPDGRGRVHAWDVTHDPPRFDAHAFAEHLRATKNPRIRYVISNGRIFAGPDGPSPWQWRRYNGTNPHREHVHVSVRRGAYANNTSPWSVAAKPAPVVTADLDLVVVDKDLGPVVTAPAVLDPGHKLTGPRGDQLVLQKDGNLVLYGPDGKSRWQTQVRGDRVSVQRDGNLVLYRGGVAMWSSGTVAPYPLQRSWLALNPDGVLALYQEGPRFAVGGPS